MQRTRLLFFAGLGSILSPGWTQAAEPAAGKAMVEAVCAACHGVHGISATPAFPNLAGQQEDYLRAALTAYRESTRKAPIMNNVAANLKDEDIANLAAYLSSLKRCE